MVVIEGTCENCANEYTYFTVPINRIYVTYLFYDRKLCYSYMLYKKIPYAKNARIVILISH